MRNTAITQVALIGISIVIIFSYIRPTFANIRVVQDEVYEYQNAALKAQEFNNLLQQLLARERGFTTDDKAALNRFLPAEIDQLAVMQDVATIVTNNNAQVVDLSAGDVVTPNADVSVEEASEEMLEINKFASQEFTLKFAGDYASLKGFLRSLESASYIIEVKNLKYGAVGEETGQFSSADTSTISEFELTLKVYALAKQE